MIISRRALLRMFSAVSIKHEEHLRISSLMRKIHRNTFTHTQAAEGSRPLDVNSVLCLADRTALGRIEDVFGPVKAPLYVLRAAAGDVAAAATPGVAVFSVAKHASFVVPEKLKSRGYVCGVLC